MYLISQKTLGTYRLLQLPDYVQYFKLIVTIMAIPNLQSQYIGVDIPIGVKSIFNELHKVRRCTILVCA